MQVMLEVTVVAQTLHLEQVTNNRFRNHLGSFFSDKKTSRQKLLVFWLLYSSKIKFKPRQLRLAVGMITDFVSLIYNLKAVL